jgi:hypothetical protein
LAACERTCAVTDELRYILDPSDVYGPDFPGETFRVLKNNDIKRYGEFRTQRLVLEAWDRLGLAPRNRDGRYAMESATATTTSSPPAVVTAPPSTSGSAATSSQPRSAPQPTTASATHAQTAPTAPTANGRQVRPTQPSAPRRETERPSSLQEVPASGDRPAGGMIASQGMLPGVLPLFATVDDDLRPTVLRRSLEVLAAAGPLTGREIAQRLARNDSRIDRRLVNNVLTHEGADAVTHDSKTGQYRLRPRRSSEKG